MPNRAEKRRAMKAKVTKQLEMKMRKPKNFDPDYAGAWVAEHNRRFDLMANAIIQVRDDVTKVLQQQANMVHYCIGGFHILVEKGLLTNEEILTYLQKNSDKTPDEVLVDAGLTGNETADGCAEQGVLQGSGDFGDKNGTPDSGDPVTTSSNVDG